MGRNRVGGAEGTRPVDPREAVEHGNDPEDVKIHRRASSTGGGRDAGGRAFNVRHDGEREEARGREGSGRSMERTRS